MTTGPDVGLSAASGRGERQPVPPSSAAPHVAIELPRPAAATVVQDYDLVQSCRSVDVVRARDQGDGMLLQQHHHSKLELREFRICLSAVRSLRCSRPGRSCKVVINEPCAR